MITHGALVNLGKETAAPVEEKPVPAVSIRKSISDDYLICLEDVEKFKSLKRHLRTHYNMSPEEYRTKWGLPVDYPMVAPSYAEARSKLAKRWGWGNSATRRRRSVAAPRPPPDPLFWPRPT